MTPADEKPKPPVIGEHRAAMVDGKRRSVICLESPGSSGMCYVVCDAASREHRILKLKVEDLLELTEYERKVIEVADRLR